MKTATRKFRFSKVSTFSTYLFWILFFAVLIWLLGPNIIENRSENENAAWFYAHMLGGSLVLILGPLQFIGAIRNRFYRYHRVAGYIYLAGSVLSVAALIRILALPGCDACLPSQLTAVFLWILCAGVAIWAIRRGNILMHQHNMARSFVFASYFLLVRLLDRFGIERLLPFVKTEDARIANSDWLAWVIPLLLVEFYFGHKWSVALSACRKALINNGPA